MASPGAARVERRNQDTQRLGARRRQRRLTAGANGPARTPAVCCMLFRLISRAIAAMSSPCASTSAPTTRWGARREQPRVRRGQQTAAALEAYQLRGCELPGWPLPARQVLPERDTKPLFVCLRLLAQRGLRLGAAGERLSALHTYCAAQQKKLTSSASSSAAAARFTEFRRPCASFASRARPNAL